MKWNRIKRKKLPTSRAGRLAAAMSLAEDAAAEVECLKDELEEWQSGMEGTNLDSTDKYEQLGTGPS